jgi:colanic acid biosynthesis protein WcaH
MFTEHFPGAPLVTVTPPRLSRERFRQAVDMLPLVSIDLLVRDGQGRYLLGLRSNPPAQGSWFVPGGRIRKGETRQHALRRLAAEELGLVLPAEDWHFKGVYEHFYDTNFAGDAGSATHYVVLAHQLQLSPGAARLQPPAEQHRSYRWACPMDMAGDAGVHAYTQAYFTEQLR